ncbi:unnamed protein product, partial [Effrenium voratum]
MVGHAAPTAAERSDGFALASKRREEKSLPMSVVLAAVAQDGLREDQGVILEAAKKNPRLVLSEAGTRRTVSHIFHPVRGDRGLSSGEGSQFWRQQLQSMSGVQLCGIKDQAYISNPFRAALLALLLEFRVRGDDGWLRTRGGHVSPEQNRRSFERAASPGPSAAVAAWAFCEFRAALYPEALEDVGLMPKPKPIRKAAKQESFVGGAIAAGLNWFWDDATLSDLQTAVSRAWSGTSGCKDEDQEEEEPRPLLESFMAGLSSENGLSQRAQDALATAIMELGSGTKVRVLARVATDASAWLQESAGTVLALAEGHRPSKTESPRSLTVSTAQSTPSAMARYTPSREGTAGTAASREEASTAAETLLCAFFEELEQH